MTSPNIIETDIVLLGDDLVSSGQAFPLSAAAPNIIRAWRVEVRGVAKAAGQDVTIVANQVAFYGPGGSIDTSGVDAVNKWAPGDKPLTPGTAATNGTPGNGGDNGTDAGNVAIYAALITGTVTVRAVGGTGGRGQDGGDGSAGGAAAAAADVGSAGPPCPPPTGPQGPQGGQGGAAGPPGKSGRGGNVDIWVLAGSNASAPPITADLRGGAAPAAATAGNPGPGGPGGKGGVCFYWVPSRDMHGNFKGMKKVTSRPGKQGPTGATGPQADPPSAVPTAGADGLLNGQNATATPPPPCHALVDSNFAANCSVQQLWSILISAENNYLNERFIESAPRLMWVATMARLLAQKMASPVHA